MQKQTRILQAYTLYSPDPGKTPPNTAKNTVEYQDEITRTRAFLLKTTAASVQAASDFEARLTKEEKTDSRIQGLRQMRVGLFEIISGVALDLRNPASASPTRRCSLAPSRRTLPASWPGPPRRIARRWSRRCRPPSRC